MSDFNYNQGKELIGISRTIEIMLANFIATLFPASNQIKSGDMQHMKIKTGHEIESGKFWMQITHRKSLRAMRIYMSPEEYSNFIYHMEKISGFESRDRDRDSLQKV